MSMKKTGIIALGFLFTILAQAQYTGISPKDRDIAIKAYKALNNSEMQQKLRKNQEWFAGPVYWHPGEASKEKLVYEFKRIASLGFNMVRYYPVDPGDIEYQELDFEQVDRWFDVAKETGIRIIFHPKMEQPPLSMLTQQGITLDEFKALPATDNRYLKIMDEFIKPIIIKYKDHPALLAWGGWGEPHNANHHLYGNDTTFFANWLKEKYGTIEALNLAWNYYPAKGQLVKSFEDAWKFTDAHNKNKWVHGFDVPVKLRWPIYGAQRDMIKYQAEKELNRTQAAINLIRKYDNNTPITTGSHNVFLNQPMLGWDIGEWARMADMHFTSIHLPWHFSLVNGEVDRPIYMQARLTKDYFKYGWTSAFETTGGAVQYSGGYGNAMTPELMRRLTLSYLAAGNQSIAFWTWNHRDGGWEVGEYGMVSLDNQITPWAEEAGKVAKGMKKHIGELWEANNQPKVGILQVWDNDAMLLMEPERHDIQEGVDDFAKGTKMQAKKAQVGLARALINKNISFEYVTAQEIMEGIAAYYPVIYVPHARAVSNELYEKLKEYVAKGGRLIADVQFGFIDEYGKLRPTGKDGRMDELFGAYFSMIHDTRTNQLTVNEMDVNGFYGDISSTKARPIYSYQNGKPAVTEHNYGKGMATLVGFDAAYMCHTGNEAIEDLIATIVNYNDKPQWECNLPMTYRLYGEKADHYFIFNDGEAKNAIIKAYDANYTKGTLVLEEATIDVSGTISVLVPAQSALWIRLEKE